MTMTELRELLLSVNIENIVAYLFHALGLGLS